MQLGNLCEETSNAPEVSRLQARPSTRVSVMRSQETKLQTQFLTLHQEIARVDDPYNQIRSAIESMDIKKSWMSAVSTDVEIRTHSRSD